MILDINMLLIHLICWKNMKKTTFLIVGKHAVLEALKNPSRKIERVFLTEESKKNIHRKSPKRNLLEDVKVYFKTKKDDLFIIYLCFIRILACFPSKSHIAIV